MYTAGLWHPSYGISTSWVMGVKKGKALSLSVPDGLVCAEWELWVSERVNEWVSEQLRPFLAVPLRQQQKSNSTGDAKDDRPYLVWASVENWQEKTLYNPARELLKNKLSFYILHLNVCQKGGKQLTSAYERLWHLLEFLMMSKMLVDDKVVCFSPWDGFR